jgi:hypothetical protein
MTHYNEIPAPIVRPQSPNLHVTSPALQQGGGFTYLPNSPLVTGHTQCEEVAKKVLCTIEVKSPLPDLNYQSNSNPTLH